MDKVKAFLMQHKWTVLGGVVIFVGILFIMRHAGGGGSTVTSAVASDPNAGAVLQAQTQLQLAGLQLQGQNSAYAGQLALQQNQLDHDYATTTYTGGLQAALATKSMDLEAALQTLQLNTNADMQHDQFAYSLAGQQSAENASIAALTLQTEANNHVVDVNAATTLGLSQTNANLQTTLSGFNKDVQIAQSNNNLAATQAQAGAANHASNNSMLSGIFSSVLGAFF